MPGPEAILRQRFEPLGELGGRSDYERDYTAILYSHAFRRLKHKTQVFFFPVNDHISTRLDHSLYVATISSVICRNLAERGAGCDPILASAIGIGHDLGHAPFGHAGEERLRELAGEIGGFKHEAHGLRVVDKIEKPRPEKPVIGLNLTFAVRDGIAKHSGESKVNTLSPSAVDAPDSLVANERDMPCTLEGCVVRLVDKVAYLGRDIEDAVIADFIKEDDLPAEIHAKIGAKNGEIVDLFVMDIIENSSAEQIALSDATSELMDRMFDLNYERIYRSPQIKPKVDRVHDLLKGLFEKLLGVVRSCRDDISKYDGDNRACVVLGDFINKRRNLYWEEEYGKDEEGLFKRIVLDFIATLTDRFAVDAFSEFYLPKPMVRTFG